MISPRPNSCAVWKSRPPICASSNPWPTGSRTKSATRSCRWPRTSSCSRRKYKDKEFRESLDQALADGVKRVTRLINQMRFLAREGHIEQETFVVGKLIEEAYQEARKHQSADAGKLQFENGGKPVVITGDRAALKHALAEIMLNALQANPKEPKIGVTLHTDANRDGVPDVQIEVQDNGSGFTAEAARKAPAPSRLASVCN